MEILNEKAVGTIKIGAMEHKISIYFIFQLAELELTKSLFFLYKFKKSIYNLRILLT